MEFFALSFKEKEAYANDAASGKFEGYGTKMLKQPNEKIESLHFFLRSTVNFGQNILHVISMLINFGDFQYYN